MKSSKLCGNENTSALGDFSQRFELADERGEFQQLMEQRGSNPRFSPANAVRGTA